MATDASVPEDGDEKTERGHAMRPEKRQTSPFLQRAPDQPEVELFEIAKPSVNQFA
jgi:hypothetical protein